MAASTTATRPLSHSQLLSNLSTPWKLRWFFLTKLPSCWFWGVRLLRLTPDEAEVGIRLNRRNQNPFQSVYFAALCGAAELSTGLLAVLALEDQGRVSMLITDIQAKFVKKATGQIVFKCDAGPSIRKTVDQAVATGEGQQIVVSSTGFNEREEVVCEVLLTWSFKAKR